MLGLWLHTPLVRGQNVFYPPLIHENVANVQSLDVENSGNDYFAFGDGALLVGVADGTDPHIYIDYDNGNITSTLPLGGIGVSDLRDPDVSGAYNGNVARFLVVYTAYINGTDKRVMYEVWEFDGSTLSRPWGPDILSLSCPTCITPNVDVTNNGGNSKAVVVFSDNGDVYVKASENLFNTPADIINDLNHSVTANGARLDDTGCDYISDKGYVDVSISDFETRFPSSPKHIKVHIAYTSFDRDMIYVRSYNFVEVQSAITGSYDLDCQTSFNPSFKEFQYSPFSLINGIVTGKPRITSQGGFDLTIYPEQDVNHFALTFPVYRPNSENAIIMFVSDYNIVLHEDMVNHEATTYRCWNDHPAITYATEHQYIMVVWSFYDCNNCVMADIECHPNDPVNIAGNAGTYILAKHYYWDGTRFFGYPISVVNGENLIMPSNPNTSTPSISGKEYDYNTSWQNGASAHYTYIDYNQPSTLTTVYKYPEMQMLNLRPDKDTQLTIKEELIKSDVHLYPSILSAAENLNVQIDREVKNVSYSITDINGRVLQTGQINVEEGQFLIKPGINSSGVYFLKLTIESQPTFHKFVIK